MLLSLLEYVFFNLKSQKYELTEKKYFSSYLLSVDRSLGHFRL